MSEHRCSSLFEDAVPIPGSSPGGCLHCRFAAIAQENGVRREESRRERAPPLSTLLRSPLHFPLPFPRKTRHCLVISACLSAWLCGCPGYEMAGLTPPPNKPQKSRTGPRVSKSRDTPQVAITRLVGQESRRAQIPGDAGVSRHGGTRTSQRHSAQENMQRQPSALPTLRIRVDLLARA